MSSLKICLVSPDASRTVLPGPSQIIWDMAGHLVDLGHEVHIVAPQAPHSQQDPRIYSHSFVLPPKAYRWFGGHYWLTKRMVDVVKTLDVDIVHAAEYLSSAVHIQWNPHVPVVLTVPGNIFQRLATPEGNQASYLFTELIKWAGRVSAKRCAGVVSFSREMMDWWGRTGTPAQRLHLIPYGVDIRHFQRVSTARTRLGVDKDALVLLYVGRLDREKGLFDLLAAFNQIDATSASRRPELHLVGGGPLQEELQRTAENMGLAQRIFFHGPATRDQLPAWYSVADLLVLPSWIEPFGRVILEAFSCGTPVISSSTGGPVDLVTDGQTGWLFPPRDVHALTKLFQNIVDHPERLPTLGAAALQQVHEHFAWRRIVERLVSEVYIPIVEERNSLIGKTLLKQSANSAGGK